MNDGSVKEYCPDCGELLSVSYPREMSSARYLCKCAGKAQELLREFYGERVDDQTKIERPEDWVTDHWTTTDFGYGILQVGTIE